jgi:hypothetical protein
MSKQNWDVMEDNYEKKEKRLSMHQLIMNTLWLIDALNEIYLRARVIVFSGTFNNISIISWLLVLFMEEKTTDLPQGIDKLYHIMLHRMHLAWAGFELTMLEVTCTDCICNCKSYHHAITTTTDPRL